MILYSFWSSWPDLSFETYFVFFDFFQKSLQTYFGGPGSLIVFFGAVRIANFFVFGGPGSPIFIFGGPGSPIFSLCSFQESQQLSCFVSFRSFRFIRFVSFRSFRSFRLVSFCLFWSFAHLLTLKAKLGKIWRLFPHCLATGGTLNRKLYQTWLILEHSTAIIAGLKSYLQEILST